MNSLLHNQPNKPASAAKGGLPAPLLGLSATQFMNPLVFKWNSSDLFCLKLFFHGASFKKSKWNISVLVSFLCREELGFILTSCLLSRASGCCVSVKSVFIQWNAVCLMPEECHQLGWIGIAPIIDMKICHKCFVSPFTVLFMRQEKKYIWWSREVVDQR